MPIYRDDLLVGGIGVSGDGIDQDDMIAFLGLDRAGPDARHDQQRAAARCAPITCIRKGVHLRYVQCPFTPFLDSSQQNVCKGR